MTENERKDFKVELMLDGTHSRACFEYLRASLFALASACEWTRCCTKDDTMPCPSEQRKRILEIREEIDLIADELWHYNANRKEGKR